MCSALDQTAEGPSEKGIVEYIVVIFPCVYPMSKMKVILVLLMQMEDLTAGLGPKENETKTMGTRRTEAARAAGEGAPCLTAPSLISVMPQSAY